MQITEEFWDFIEKYLPNYHQRADVLRQSDLQVYIDGHESPIEDEMTVNEAEDELHHILYNLYAEAIDAYTKAQGFECDECMNHKTKYCPCCGKRTNNDIIEDPYRCEECGSLDVQELAWVDTNTQVIQDAFPVEEQDLHCKYCDQHTHQIKESELMEDIQNWWGQLDGETMEIITDLEYESYSAEPDPDSAFDKACNNHWNALDIEQKISIWKHYNYDQKID